MFVDIVVWFCCSSWLAFPIMAELIKLMRLFLFHWVICFGGALFVHKHFFFWKTSTVSRDRWQSYPDLRHTSFTFWAKINNMACASLCIPTYLQKLQKGPVIAVKETVESIQKELMLCALGNITFNYCLNQKFFVLFFRQTKTRTHKHILKKYV